MNGNDIVELSLVLKKFLTTDKLLGDHEKHKMMHVINSLENRLYKIKSDYGLHHLDNSIISKSISESFFRDIKKYGSSPNVGKAYYI